ncbi:DUF4432 family protein [Paenibacillus cremeus]|uniref:DUF4432 family protein n=1 Tax=Paenibacillus cremeus TaxID=2163881 RepID=A0A559K7S3_9BACL|nr:DUF4432 family protein [Paenibacillus cremeus]TVY08168.1 DUF4432 family protein [Paenibacillus cremeus]
MAGKAGTVAMAPSLYRKHRLFGCRITDDLTYKGYRSILLENETLLIHLLLDKGSEPIRWLHKPTDTDFIWQTRMGLLPVHHLYPDYQMSYIGGWQEMFPEVSFTHEYRGATLHRGESAITPWDYEIVFDTPEQIQVRLTNRLRSLPFRIEKTITMRQGDSRVKIDEAIHNESPVTLEANWGHHLAYGAPFLSETSRIELEPGALVHHPGMEQTLAWPNARQGDDLVDLSRMAAPGTKRDLLYVTMAEGMYRLRRPEDGLALQVRWDTSVWPYLWYWQNYAADSDAPFFACDYNIGLEMFNVPPKLTVAEAVKQGVAIVVPPGGSRHAWLEIEVTKEG